MKVSSVFVFFCIILMECYNNCLFSIISLAENKSKRMNSPVLAPSSNYLMSYLEFYYYIWKILLNICCFTKFIPAFFVFIFCSYVTQIVWLLECINIIHPNITIWVALCMWNLFFLPEACMDMDPYFLEE